MDFIFQIAFGSLCLVLSALIHVGVFAAGIPKIARLAQALPDKGLAKPGVRTALLLSAGLGLLIAAHTITIWLWAVILFVFGDFADFATSFYFSTVTYTTLGYGDVVVGPSLRIFASFAAITGLLTFGLSTAFLVGFLVRILPDLFDGPKKH